MTYRADPDSQVSQLSLYSGYKSRFDPYSSTSPLLGGQDLIELVCATFPGCDMSKAGEDYYLSGLKEKEGGEGDWEKTLKGVAEPVRAATWYVGRARALSPTTDYQALVYVPTIGRRPTNASDRLVHLLCPSFFCSSTDGRKPRTRAIYRYITTTS